jgi:hypothetical protein
MKYRFTSDGTAVVLTGLKFDLPKVVGTARALIEMFAKRLGVEKPLMGLPNNPNLAGQRWPWPMPGETVYRKIWQDAMAFYEVTDEVTLHQIGNVTFKAFLMGKMWCTYHVKTGILSAWKTSDLSEFDPRPTIVIYGLETKGRPGLFEILPSGEMLRLLATMKDALDTLGLQLEVETMKDDATPPNSVSVAYIRFPHDRYGAGAGDIRVHCVDEHGNHIPPDSSSQN